ncbi:sulfotransferase [Haliea sp.]|uniref:sulfotransferase n=1 Tax=Haliea sp. TaxID=1932666 RepID=UPI0025BEB070|nr:sulfotransferase [Haliea sp.]
MLTSKIRRHLRKSFRIRPSHCFCLGAAKTGTTSFSAMFADHYRSAHEPNVEDLTRTVEKVILGEMHPQEIKDWLYFRDRQLNLEIEASHPLGYLAPWLPEVFPRAKFVITIRDPLPWLKSRLNFHYYKTPEVWQRYRDFIWGRHHRGYEPEEAVLKELGLYSLNAYLTQYSEQYKLLFENLPEDRTLMLRTELLSDSIDTLAAFLELDPTTIMPKHENVVTVDSNVIDLLPTAFVSSRIKEKCDWIVDHLRNQTPNSDLEL